MTKKKDIRTNGGKPHICNTIQVHNTLLTDRIILCGNCKQAVDCPQQKTK